MGIYLDIACDFVEDPRRAARAAADRRPFGLGIFGFIVAGVSLFLAQGLLQRSFFPPGAWTLAFYCLWQVVYGFLLASLLHFFAELAGGRGGAVGLFVLLGLSELVWVLALPAALILRALMLDGWPATSALFILLGMAAIVLKARSIRDNYGLGTGRALLVLVLPYVAVVGLAVLAAALALVGLASSALRLIS